MSQHQIQSLRWRLTAVTYVPRSESGAINTELLSTLQRLGFTEYEAKVYLALLRHSPLTGYAVAQRSGVPRSKVYEVLNGMVGRGEVLVSYGEPTQYGPLPV